MTLNELPPASVRKWLVVAAAAAAIGATSACLASPFPVTVTGVGPFGDAPHDDPLACLGRPAVWTYDPGFPPWVPSGSFGCSMVYGAWGTDPSGAKLVVTLREGASVTAEFSPPLVDDPENWYGRDFIVFGNAFFGSTGFVERGSDMEQIRVKTGGAGTWEPMTVSVSQDGLNWYDYSEGPFADDFAPAQPLAWDWVEHRWGPELDFTRPVPPSLSREFLGDLSVADATDTYRGSAGGTAFDLGVTDLPADPVSGRKWARFVKVTANVLDMDGFAYEGELDAIVRVSHSIVPATCGVARQLPDGSRVRLAPACVTAATFETGRFCYVQHPSGGAGVRVTGRVLERGAWVSLEGVMDTVDGARVVRATGLGPAEPGAPVRPMGMRLSAVGGTDIEGGQGAGNVGMLARVWGHVVARTLPDASFTIADGSGTELRCEAPRNVSDGVTVAPGFTPPPEGSFVRVEGVVSVRQDAQSGGAAPVLLLRSGADVTLPD